MLQTSMRKWLLVLAGLSQALFAIVNLLMRNPDGSVALRTLAVQNTILLQARFGLAAGVLTIAAGLWGLWRNGSAKYHWLLLLNGAALSAYAVVPVLRSGPLSFRPFFALMLILMAASVGILALTTARDRSGWPAGYTLLALNGVALIVFALAFFAMEFRWIRLNQPGSYFVWMGAFFGLSALCMLELAVRPNTRRSRFNGMSGVSIVS